LTAEEGEFYPLQSRYAADAVNRTLRSRLEALKLTGMVARDPLEALSFAGVWRVWKKASVLRLFHNLIIDGCF